MTDRLDFISTFKLLPEDKISLRLGGNQRDWEILETVGKFRLMTGKQIERLFFTNISEPSRARARRRTMARIVTTGALKTLPTDYYRHEITQITGGIRPRVYALHRSGWRAMVKGKGGYYDLPWFPRVFEPGARFMPHVLMLSELYVRLVEKLRDCGFAMGHFIPEPSCWLKLRPRGRLKPDAYIRLPVPGENMADHYWIEADRGTETVPTVRAKLQTYLDYERLGYVAERTLDMPGQLLPGDGFVPRVLVVTLDDARCTALRALVSRLGDRARGMFRVMTLNDAAGHIAAELAIPTPTASDAAASSTGGPPDTAPDLGGPGVQ